MESAHHRKKMFTPMFTRLKLMFLSRSDHLRDTLFHQVLILQYHFYFGVIFSHPCKKIFTFRFTHLNLTKRPESLRESTHMVIPQQFHAPATRSARKTRRERGVSCTSSPVSGEMIAMRHLEANHIPIEESAAKQ